MRYLSIILLLFVFISPSLTNSADAVPYDRQALLLLRVLAYDRNMKADPGASVPIGIVYKEANASSKGVQAKIFQALKGLENKVQVKKHKFEVIPIPFSDAGSFSKSIKAHNLETVYVCSGLDGEVGDISKASRASSTLTMTGNENYVTSKGLTVGFVIRNSKPTIVINSNAARAEGSKFEMSLMRVAEVI
jgi:hypothetical protein